MIRTIDGIRVRETGGAFIARHGQHSASATSCALLAVRRCAAKALGLCPPRNPPGMRMSDYYAAVDHAAGRIQARRDPVGTYTATFCTAAPSAAQEGGPA